MSDRSQIIGKWLEDKVKEAMDYLKKEYPCNYYRFPDSKAARNYLPKQPGDHLFLADGFAVLVEEKCSETHDSLRGGFSSLWKKSQAAEHRKWHRAECPSWVIFCNYNSEDVEIWDGEYIAMARSKGDRIPSNVKPIVIGHIDNLHNLILEAINYESENRKPDESY